MSGYPTNGLPAATTSTANGAATIPFTGLETFAVDTNIANGISPQSEAVSFAQIPLLGLGAVKVLTDAATIAVDCSTGSQFSVTLTATGRTLTMSNMSPGQQILVYVKEDATGSRTITTYTNVLWAAGTAPTLTTTAAATDVLRFTWNATLGKWVGETVAKAIA